ncbi:MAG: TetR/AcrR family transcriptional regulator [Actinobacteria bacterium]|nr:TetR/AcrR family transcriptional regulator [Actinomycetota bacterium]
MARTGANDWVEAGIALLREEGHASLRIDDLCRRLGRTKGSFYHHFPSFGAFRDTLLARWETDLTEHPIAHADLEPDPELHPAQLSEAVRGLDHRLDLAIRSWALRDAHVREALDRVDERRVGFLAELWAERTGRRATAMLLARLDYAAFVGAQQLYPDLSAADVCGLEDSLAKALRLLAESLAAPAK